MSDLTGQLEDDDGRRDRVRHAAGEGSRADDGVAAGNHVLAADARRKPDGQNLADESAHRRPCSGKNNNNTCSETQLPIFIDVAVSLLSGKRYVDRTRPYPA